jgi:FecR protein
MQPASLVPPQRDRAGHPHRSPLAYLVGCGVLAWTTITSLSPASGLDSWRVVVRDSGKLESLQPGQSSWSPVWRSRVLTNGDLARTKAASRARVLLADQSQFTIGADTVVEMTRFELSPSGRTVLFRLQVGKIRATVAKALGAESRFEVSTPNGVLAARGTEFYVEQFAPPAVASQLIELATAGAFDFLAADPPAPAAGTTYVRVMSGRVSLQSPLGNAMIGPGGSALFGTHAGVQLNAPYPDGHANAGGRSSKQQESSSSRGGQKGASESSGSSSSRGGSSEGTPSSSSASADPSSGGTSSSSGGTSGAGGSSGASGSSGGSATIETNAGGAGSSGAAGENSPPNGGDADLMQPSGQSSSSGGPSSSGAVHAGGSSGSGASSPASSSGVSSPPIGAGSGSAQPITTGTLQIRIHTR